MTNKNANLPAWLDSVAFNADGLIPAIAQDHFTGEILMMAWMNAESLLLTAQTKTAVYFSRSRGKLWHKGETSGHTQLVHDIYLDCDGDCLIITVTQQGGIACHTGRKSCFYRRLEIDDKDSKIEGKGDTGEWHTVMPVLKDPDAIYGDADAKTTNASKAPDISSFRANTNQDHSSHDILSELDKVLAERKSADADSSYVANLYAKGINKILEKVGEEAIETVIAGKDLATYDTNREEAEPLRQDLIYEVADVWFHTMVTLAWFNIESDAVLSELARRFGLSGIAEKNSRTE